MTLLAEYEAKTELGLDYKRAAEDIINLTLEYLECPYEAEINLTITDNSSIALINKEFRGIDAPTDVLSFPLVDYDEPCCFDGIEDNAEDYFNLDTGELMLGDIVISADKVISQAEEYGHTIMREYCFLIVHSMLHLFGYDHINDEERIVMEDLQNKILDTAGIYR